MSPALLNLLYLSMRPALQVNTEAEFVSEMKKKSLMRMIKYNKVAEDRQTKRIRALVPLN
jgi:hypothetical protein